MKSANSSPKPRPFLVIDRSPAAREKALAQLLPLSASVSYTDAVVMAVADEYGTQKDLRL
jgi:hypothetical protein